MCTEIFGDKWRKIESRSARLEKIVSRSKFALKFELVNPDSLSGIEKKLGPRDMDNLEQKMCRKIFDGKWRKIEGIVLPAGKEMFRTQILLRISN